VLRCFVDWGVLEDTGEKVSTAAPVYLVEDNKLAILIEAAMVASGSDVGAKRSPKAPALFPFAFGVNITDLAGNDRLEHSVKDSMKI